MGGVAPHTIPSINSSPSIGLEASAQSASPSSTPNIRGESTRAGVQEGTVTARLLDASPALADRTHSGKEYVEILEPWQREADAQLVAVLERRLSYTSVARSLVDHTDDRVLSVRFYKQCDRYLKYCRNPVVRFYSVLLRTSHAELLDALQQQARTVGENMDIRDIDRTLFVPAIKCVEFQMTREEHEVRYQREYLAITASKARVVNAWEAYSLAVKTFRDKNSDVPFTFKTKPRT
jgi:hypothetical protein